MACTQKQLEACRRWRKRHPEQRRAADKERRTRDIELTRLQSRQQYAKNRERRLGSAHRYYTQHREKILRVSREWYAANTEEAKRRDRKRYVENREKELLRAKEYRLAHPEEHKERSRQWRKNNPQKHKDGVKRARLARPDLFTACKARWWKKNAAREIQRIYLWRKNNRERFLDLANVHAHRRRSRKLGAQGFHTIEQWYARVAYFGWRCVYCGIPLTKRTLTKDHVIPLSRRGSDWASNLRPACHPCNCSKGPRKKSPKF